MEAAGRAASLVTAHRRLAEQSQTKPSLSVPFASVVSLTQSSCRVAITFMANV
jgi:hypothetical protein